jgi:hypothetical protein
LLTVPLILVGAAVCFAWIYALGRICLRRLAAPWEVAVAVGAAVQSLLVFLLLCFGAASRAAFLGLSAVSLALAWRFRASTLKDPPAEPASVSVRAACAAIAAVYGVLYFVNALAPELQGDAITYHLGFAAEYARTGAFSDRVGFYEMVPQGIEMLFTVAFSIGRHSAAKLVHFGFLLASVPLLIRIGRRLGLGDTASLAAAGFYFCAPITGISGTCAYNDAAMVFFVLVAFYLLLVWRELHDDRYLLPLGLAAGFCFGVKFTGIVVLPLVMAAVLATSRRVRPVLWLVSGVVMIAPWMIRDAVLSGNPLAPLFNRWFPNPWFHASMEEELAKMIRTYGVSGSRIPFELALGGRLQGLYGPLLLAIPLGLAALRRQAGRWCWVAGGALAIPWFWNHGARFLMSTFVFAALALVMVLPRRVTVACLLFHAVFCWPQVVPLYAHSNGWQLEEFPWQAALRLESDDTYLRRQLENYALARLIDRKTAPGEGIFTLTAVPWTYTERRVLEYWHSGQADRMLAWLKAAGLNTTEPVYDVKASWPPRLLRALRFRLHAAYPKNWEVQEIRLWSGKERVRSSPQWTLSGWPNVWEMTAAFDDNPGTFWRTWMPMRAGMYVQADLNRPQWLSGATLISRTPRYGVPVEFYGMDGGGKWHAFGVGTPAERVPEDVRRAAMRAIRHEGFHYIAAANDQALGVLGRAFLGHEAEWGLENLGAAGNTTLYRIR